jgi:23S rRNA (cytosine1962-C5)-methyltransferase
MNTGFNHEPAREESRQPQLIHFEDEHLLVVNKPPSLSTHSPNPYAGEGMFEWLRNRQPRWRALAIIHRLDKETSGLLVFAKTSLANRSLAEQFSSHSVRKKYVFLTDRLVKPDPFTALSAITRAGEKYLSRPLHAGGATAETRFQLLSSTNGRSMVEAQPITGRTHQIRVQASAAGFAILGDILYGGAPAKRLCLHALELNFHHPVTGAAMNFHAAVDFDYDPRLWLRTSLIGADSTDAYRIVHGAADGCPGWYVDRLGDFLLSQGTEWLTAGQKDLLMTWQEKLSLAGAYHKLLNRRVRATTLETASPRWVRGQAAPHRFVTRENGLEFELSFKEGYSSGLFLDQRENRRRLLVGYAGADFGSLADGRTGQEILNTFAYTCGYSVCAAKAGARVTSLDLSRKYLEWGKQNFVRNQIDPAAHEFIYGDVWDWLGRLRRKHRKFAAVILDPPIFSTSKIHGAFRIEKDYPALVASALPLLQSNGVLFASSSSSRVQPEEFLKSISSAIGASGRSIVQQHYVPQPPDFPISRLEPAYLKTVWIRVK